MLHNKVAIYMSDHLLAEIASRSDNRSGTISRDLERLYTLYKRALREVPLTESEACLIVDALNGTISDANTAPMLWAAIEDAIQLDRLAEKWEVDGPALVEKLRSLSAFHCMALIDAAERFWYDAESHTDIRAAVKKFFHIN